MSLRPLALDFAQPARNGRVLGTILAGLGAVALLWVVAQIGDAGTERDRQATRLDDTRRLARRTMPSLAVETKATSNAVDPDARGLATEIRAANDVLDQLGMPWDVLFGEIESAITPDVALTQILPDPRGRRVVVTGEARHLNGMLTFLARLDAAPSLAETHLRQHAWRSDDPHRPMSFTLESRWTPAR